jgi:exodeoxyribonuclease-3
MKIATWNVNSIKSRLEAVIDWLRTARPDVLLLQEIKCLEENFPTLEISAEGYRAAICGQRTYSGVAILSREPLDATCRALPGDDGDAQARYIEANIRGVRIASIYLPNGNPIGTEKFAYKLAWMERLRTRVRDLLSDEVPFVLGGDFNVAPMDLDAYDPGAFSHDAICQPESRAAFRRILHLGVTDAFRAVHGSQRQFTWWDYRAGAWQRNQGLRIDHLLLSPQTNDRLTDAGVDMEPRKRDNPSDHTPVWCELAE